MDAVIRPNEMAMNKDTRERVTVIKAPFKRLGP